MAISTRQYESRVLRTKYGRYVTRHAGPRAKYTTSTSLDDALLFDDDRDIQDARREVGSLTAIVANVKVVVSVR